MNSSKLSTLRQYQLLQNVELEEDSDSQPTNNSARSYYFEYHYRFRLTAFLLASLILFYLGLYLVAIPLAHTEAGHHRPAAVAGAISRINYLTNLEDANSTDITKYLINTPQCTIPQIPLFTDQTRPLYSAYQSKEYVCPAPDETAAIRRINATWVQIPAGYNCTATEIERNVVNEGLRRGKIFNFGNETLKEFPDSNAVEVSCVGIKPKKIIPLIPLKRPIWFNATEPLPDLSNRPNILAIGIDSISRLNFLRHLNECAQFLTEHHFEGPLFGHHKVGDNTWPNLMAIFTGIKAWKLEQAFPKSRKLDSLPLIFKEFSSAGYLTTYIENMPKFGLWTYHKKSGFVQQPYDYWMRPVNIAIYQELKNKFCYKDRLEMEYYYDYVVDQMAAFRQRNQRFLTFIHMAAVTHDIFNHAQYADLPLKRFLSRIFTNKLHEDTLIIFYSDHGIRYGKIMKTASGYHESRMPFVYFHLPKGLRLQNGQRMWMDSEIIRKIIRINSRRLTSQYDLHATLKHMLQGVPSENELYGRSLFDLIPRNRSCEQAGISEEYCLCKSYIQFNDSTSTSMLSFFTIDYLNRKLAPFSEKCVELTLGQTLEVKIAETKDSVKKSFMIKLLTRPNNGTIETMLRASVYNGTVINERSIERIGSIHRLDEYGKQSRCVADTAVESFCYCRDLMEFSTTTIRNFT